MSSAGARHEAAIEQVWDRVRGTDRAVVVDSPPGAGKSTLVRELAKRLVAVGENVPIVVQTNDQADDLVIALAGAGLSTGRLHGQEWTPPTGWPRTKVRTGTKLGELGGCDVIVGTAAKWAYVKADERTWPLGVIDEAYQMSAAALVRVGHLFDRLLLVGDPGQLAPFTVADEHSVRSLATWPLDTAAGTLLRHHPDTPVIPLPVSWRLAPHTAPVISDAFYTRAFTAGAAPTDRRLELASLAHPALAHAAEHGWALLELPAAHVPRTDPALVATLADLVHQLVTAEVSTVDPSGPRPLSRADVAVGVVHRDQKAHVEAALQRRGITEVTVDTANRLQGRQYEVVLAWHPLSGRRDASAFHLEAGRLCVLASRHRQACVVVSRAGVDEQLHAYPAAEPVWLGTDPPQVDGWEANRAFLERLAPHRIPAR
ncbi:AAA family ATPase [Catellatospora chokoriensis]|uniref:Helicase n=1 Tax=Catellatospora chokoriensis TaxID=310353 RepID=A0A8J3NRR5_9ACTN|nr:AAA family ATPase [Catellatospora chokoriensis]GIF88415.1 helicase [Catellatospora chokoriensis]